MREDVPLFVDTPDLERRVRGREAETSWSAAAISRADAINVRDFVLQQLALGTPLTDDELYARYRDAGGVRTPQRLRTAREELVHPKLGEPLVREHTVNGLSMYGNAARQWVIA